MVEPVLCMLVPFTFSDQWVPAGSPISENVREKSSGSRSP